MEPKKSVVFPALRFTPDKDEKGVFLVDPRTKEFKSGVLEVTLFKQNKDGSAHFVAGYTEQVSFNKYKAIREDVDAMSVEQLKEYFPELKTEDEKESTPKSNASAGKTDASQSGEKNTPAEAKTADKVKS